VVVRSNINSSDRSGAYENSGIAVVPPISTVCLLCRYVKYSDVCALKCDIWLSPQWRSHPQEF